jgi:dienelactone hydrolase
MTTRSNSPAGASAPKAAAALLVALATALCGPAAAQEKVNFPSLDKWGGTEPLELDAYFYKPKGRKPFPALVMFHGCSGALGKSGKVTQRFRDMARLLNDMGYGVLLVDSFNPRGVPEICTTPIKARDIKEEQRWLDGYAAIDYLATRPEVIPGRVGAIGFSHGGTATLQVMDAGLPPKQGRAGFVAGVSLYPGCSTTLNKSPDFKAYNPLLILAGELDDWTPAEPCKQLAERSKGRGEPVEIEVYEGAYHSFDSDSPVRIRNDVIRRGQAVHVGGNPAAREKAYARIQEFLARHLPPK